MSFKHATAREQQEPGPEKIASIAKKEKKQESSNRMMTERVKILSRADRLMDVGGLGSYKNKPGSPASVANALSVRIAMSGLMARRAASQRYLNGLLASSHYIFNGF